MDFPQQELIRPFLAWLGIADAKDTNFLLQRHDLQSVHAALKRHRILLGISKRNSSWQPGTYDGTIYESLPDAWIYGKGFAVLLESKVGENDFSPRHMQSHLARLGAAKRLLPKVILKTWREIHSFFLSILLNLTNPSSILLVKQFIQFLEYNDMSGFSGFQRDHFDYFLLHDDDDARRWVSDQLEEFNARVLTKLQDVDPFYEIYHVGVLKRSSSYCWCAFGPKPFKYCKKYAHQTISISPNGLRMFINVETKKATERLKNAVIQKDKKERFLAELKKLHKLEPFELVLNNSTVYFISALLSFWEASG